MSYTLEQTRELAGATLQDSNGRYYRLFLNGDKGIPTYGYRTHLTGAYVCYTCGHLCECEDESDDVDTVSWSSSNPTGEVEGNE